MKVWKKPLVYCVSVLCCLLAGVAIDMACGPEADPYDYYVSFFHNNIQGQKDYGSFYYTNYQFLYSENEPASEADINAAEWAAYLGKDVNAADVKKAMYRLTPHIDSILINRYLKTGEKLPDTLAGNTFLKALELKKNLSVLKYYNFAKGMERLANIRFDSWNPRPLDTVGLRTEGNVAFKAALVQPDKFLKLRYFYQAQRLLHYGADYRDALNVYNKYIAGNQSTSHIKGWSLALKAGELRRLGDTVQAAYLFSKVFAQCPERRVQAYRNYQYIALAANKVLPLATNNSERANIYAIDGFGKPYIDLTDLQKVYQYDPTSPMVGVLLVREVNKLEEHYLTHKLYNNNRLVMGQDYDSMNKAEEQLPALLTHISKLTAFCKQLVTERKYPEYNVGNLAAAYLAWMHGDNAGGKAWLDALKNETLSPAFNDQKQLIQLLLTTQSIQRLNPVNEDQLLPTLKWLDDKVDVEAKAGKDSSVEFNDKHKFTITARNFYEQILAPEYLRQKDTVRATLALCKARDENVVRNFGENVLHAAQIVRVIRWKKVPPTEPYLNFLTSGLSKLTLNYLYELLGTTYLREHQYGKAVNAFKQVAPAYMDKQQPEEPADPFIDHINDYPKIYRYGKAKGYNKLQFAEAMNEITEKIQDDPLNAPSYYYRYATGLYNTSHYGNAWYMISYNWSAMDFGRKEKYSYDADYIKARNAEKYYLLARSLSSSEEFKAKCTIMAAKCKQKQVPQPDWWLFGAEYEQARKNYLMQLKTNDYFTELKTKYKKTDIFKKAVGECSYLKDFILMSK